MLIAIDSIVKINPVDINAIANLVPLEEAKGMCVIFAELEEESVSINYSLISFALLVMMKHVGWMRLHGNVYSFTLITNEEGNWLPSFPVHRVSGHL